MSLTQLDHFQNTVPKATGGKASHLVPNSLILLGFVSLVFAAIPEIDLTVSRLFWENGKGFSINDSSIFVWIRDANRYLTWILIATAVTLLIVSPLVRVARRHFAPHKLLFFVTFYAAGPGLAVNLIKMLVGRARPRHLEEFGGSAFFTPPWEITNQCVRNCSFISGEASSAFSLLIIVVFFSKRFHKPYLISAGLVAAAFSFNRVMFGAHFLSDVLICWCVMFALSVILWRMFSQNADQIDAIFGAQPRVYEDVNNSRRR